MDINEWLEPGCVAHRLGADSKRQALAAIADLAGPAFSIPAAEILDALLAREAQGSTGVGAGVGLPHARLRGLVRMRAVFLRLDQPVDFDAVDDRPVDLLFALFAPEDANTEHLRALARVSRLLRQTEIRRQLRQARTPDALHALLAQEASASAA
jgi:PTS system nitrogen regulatory IIA component